MHFAVGKMSLERSVIISEHSGEGNQDPITIIGVYKDILIGDAENYQYDKPSVMFYRRRQRDEQLSSHPAFRFQRQDPQRDSEPAATFLPWQDSDSGKSGEHKELAIYTNKEFQEWSDGCRLRHTPDCIDGPRGVRKRRSESPP